MKSNITVSMESELIKQVREYAAKNRSKVSHVVDNAVWAFLNPAPTVIRNKNTKTK